MLSVAGVKVILGLESVLNNYLNKNLPFLSTIYLVPIFYDSKLRFLTIDFVVIKSEKKKK